MSQLEEEIELEEELEDDGIDKDYVWRQINGARATDNDAARRDHLYRAGTQMNIIECNGDDNLTAEQQKLIFETADKLLNA